jgi:apolipoprotein N-acyltransferase
MPTRRAAALILLHAIPFALAFHPAVLFPLAWVCLVPEVLLIRGGTRRQAILGTGISHFLHGLLTIYWLAYTPDPHGPWYWPVKETMGAGPAPWLGTAAGFGLYGLFYGALARPLARSRIPTSLWLPLLWTGVECIQGKLFFFAFPWMWLGHSQFMLRPLVQVADLGGALAVSFVVAAGNGLLVDLLALRSEARRPARLDLAGIAAPIALIAAVLAYGVLRPRALEIRAGPRVLVVQPSIPQNVKNATEHDPNWRLQKMYDLTQSAARAGAQPDLVLWPETIVPVGPSDDPRLRWAALDKSAVVRSWVDDLAKRLHACFLVGSEHIEYRAGTEVEHNSAFFVAPSGEVLGRYDKIYLAPMSEETPFAESLPALHKFLRATFIPPGFVQFERGKEATVFHCKDWSIGASICFDITFSDATNRAVRNGADVIANVSNYAWFEDSAELDLARAQTMFRAIETRRGIVCCVNGGISHVVSPRGEIRDLEVGGRRKQVEGIMLAEVPTSRAQTLFVRLPADAFGWTCFVAALALAGLARWRLARRGPGPAA